MYNKNNILILFSLIIFISYIIGFIVNENSIGSGNYSGDLNWIWKNFDMCSGISLLPYSDHVYQQAPYEEIDEEKYNELFAAMPKDINWEDLAKIEVEDNTIGSQELACVGGACEL